MLCFRDSAFCAASMDGRCSNYLCARQFTEMQRQASERWMKDAPISVGHYWNRCTIRIERGVL